ncbi:sulfite exporter TauE/SafE family protein [Litorisediminicola beolgyonensis]|uniref:Probable membrane transporter protein n=1 Tax=Litorisediminicola beolgyonensis TaxID=1173614 RepID=A0ABW3ZE74_9RHOB
MDPLGWTVFAVAVPAVIFAGISKGGFGSTAAFASSSILALVLDPATALGIMLPLLMLIDLASLPPYWRRWSWPEARLLMLAGLPGVALGALVFEITDPDAIRLLIGIVCLGFVAWQVAVAKGVVAPSARDPGPVIGLASGIAVGFTSFVSHAGGLAAAIYLLGRGLGKTAYQATTVLVFWAINLVKAGIYAGLGIFSRDTLTLDLWLIPAALFGTWLGVRAHHLVPETLFFRVTYALLSVTGAKLMWDALT